jgi:hypothetical protein
MCIVFLCDRFSSRNRNPALFSPRKAFKLHDWVLQCDLLQCDDMLMESETFHNSIMSTIRDWWQPTILSQGWLLGLTDPLTDGMLKAWLYHPTTLINRHNLSEADLHVVFTPPMADINSRGVARFHKLLMSLPDRSSVKCPLAFSLFHFLKKKEGFIRLLSSWKWFCESTYWSSRFLAHLLAFPLVWARTSPKK